MFLHIPFNVMQMKYSLLAQMKSAHEYFPLGSGRNIEMNLISRHIHFKKMFYKISYL